MTPASWSTRALTCPPGGNISAEAGTLLPEEKGLTLVISHYQCESSGPQALDAAERDGAWVAVAE